MSLRPVLPAVLLSLGLNLALYAGVAWQRPAYLTDYRLCNNPDATHYVLIGHNLLCHGHYSRSDGPPYVPDMLRTPVYPLFAGGLEWLGHAGAIYLAQAALHAGSCVLLFLLVRGLFGVRPAVWASLFLATDLVLVISNFEAMSEPLFVFLILASALCLLPVRVLNDDSRPMTVRRLLGGGVLLGLAILTRPAALYLLVIYAAWYLVGGWKKKHLANGICQAACFVAPVLVLVGLWIGRNALVFSLPRLTTVDTHNLVYFVGAGAYQVRHGVSLEEAQAMIEREFDIPPYKVVQNQHHSGRSVAELHAQVRGVAWRVLSRYPGDLFRASLLGVVKATFSHDTGQLAALLGREWSPPGSEQLLRGQAEAFRRLGDNGPLLGLTFGWQLGHIALALGFGAAGVWRSLRDPRRRPAGLLLLAVLAYFYLTVALFGYEAFCRCRLPAMPFLYAFAGLGLSRPSPDEQPAPTGSEGS
jgi:4-amino-4-deoxy-L-arabinose transferase-like glycosyltransferase